MTDTQPSITVLVKDQYGKQALHPRCPAAHTFANIAGTTTLTTPTIKHIMALGYKVVYVHGEVHV
jgi:hypothetical protein